MPFSLACRDYMDRFLDEQENSQQQQQQRDRSSSPSESKRPRLAGPLQLTNQLLHHENGRDANVARDSNPSPAVTPRENGRGDRLWIGPESSSDEDDLPLIATARPLLNKMATTSMTPVAVLEVPPIGPPPGTTQHTADRPRVVAPDE